MATTCIYGECNGRNCLDCMEEDPNTTRYLVTVQAQGTAHAWVINTAPTEQLTADQVAAAIGRQRFAVVTGIDPALVGVTITPFCALAHTMFSDTEILTEREALEVADAG